MSLKISLLGAGRVGAVHARNIAANPRCELAMVCDLRLEAAEKLASQHGSVAVAEPAEAIAAADAVIIATSTDTHVELILAACAAGTAVFCEKPIDLDILRVNACLSEIERRGTPVQMGFNRRFDPSFRELRRRLHHGAIGSLELLRISSRDPQPPGRDYLLHSGGLFRDMMIHDFDMARWLLGEPPRYVHATASSLVDKQIATMGDVDTAVCTLQTSSGIICTIDNSRRATYGYDQRIEVHGEGGMLLAGNPRPTSVLCADANGVHTDVLMNFAFDRYADAFRAELDCFVDVAMGRASPSPNAADARDALVLAEAALASHQSGNRVSVDVQPIASES